MKFEITQDDNAVLITHRDRSIVFNVSVLKKSKLLEDDKDLFSEINRYIASLENQTQYALFRCFDTIRELRDDTIGVAFHVQQRETTEVIQEFYRLLDCNNLENWVRKNISLINVPTDLISRDSEKAKKANHNEKINYYLEDYEGLVFLVLALRPMIPIWGEYIHINKDAVGGKHKEYQAFKLLDNSDLVKSQPMHRLRMYIAESRATNASKKQLTSDAAVLEGISSDSLNEYLLAALLVRKVSITNVNNSIISAIFSYLKNKITETADMFKVNPKRDTENSKGDDRDRSLLENYKIATKITYGDIGFIRQYAKEPLVMAQHVDSTIDPQILFSCLETNRNYNGLTIQEHNLLITQWTLAKVFPPAGIYELTRSEVINLISVAQALMIHWGIEWLPLLVSAKYDEDMLSAVSTTRAGVSDELIDELEQIFPYKKQGKQSNKKANLALEDINKLMSRLIARSFIVNPPPCYDTNNERLNGLVECPLNIANLLARLVIRANQ